MLRQAIAQNCALVLRQKHLKPSWILPEACSQVDVVMGQKTGFFLDQRDNRARIGRLCRTASGSISPGLRCLNVFGYTGGFSVYAGRWVQQA